MIVECAPEGFCCIMRLASMVRELECTCRAGAAFLAIIGFLQPATPRQRRRCLGLATAIRCRPRWQTRPTSRSSSPPLPTRLISGVCRFDIVCARVCVLVSRRAFLIDVVILLVGFLCGVALPWNVCSDIKFRRRLFRSTPVSTMATGLRTLTRPASPTLPVSALS